MTRNGPSSGPSSSERGGASLTEFVEPLCRIHDRIRGLVVAACEEQSASDLSRVVGDSDGDVTYSIDRISESALVDGLSRDVAAHEPIVLVGEGLPGGRMILPTSATERDARWLVIVDPIDGTRGLMYQKRPAWILTGVAPNHGEETSLSDIELAVQTEIPLVKQHLSDQLWCVRGAGVHGIRYNRLVSETQPLVPRPSAATDLRHGFATVCRFFPGGRDLLAAIDDALCERLLKRQPDEAAVFEDQYACTGGQLYGLASGKDRFVADLRPLVQPIVASRGVALGHCCHPYDLCTKLIAEETGVIVTAAGGGPLEAPLNTEANVAWIGYANSALQSQIEPVLQALFHEYLRRQAE